MAATCMHCHKRRFFAQLLDALTISYEDLDRREKKIAVHICDVDQWLQSLRRRRPSCQPDPAGETEESEHFHSEILSAILRELQPGIK